MRFEIIENFEDIETVEVKYPGLTFSQEYRIDKEGNVYSPYRGWHLAAHQILKGSARGSGGYHRVSLSTPEGRKFLMVHRLMLESFNPIPNSAEMQVNHIDGNKDNNSLQNLEWCTRTENIQHSVRMHLRDNMPKGENASCVKLTEKQVLEICELLQSGTLSLAAIGERYGVSKHAIFDIKRKRSWKWLTTDYDFN